MVSAFLKSELCNLDHTSYGEQLEKEGKFLKMLKGIKELTKQ